MTSFGDALVFALVLIAIAVPLSFLASELMFESEANRNGYNTDGDFKKNGCYEMIDHTLDESGVYREFCKSDSGFLGWMDWWSNDDREFFKDVVLGFVDSDVEPNCLYGVDSFKSVELDNQIIYEYRCHIP